MEGSSDPPASARVWRRAEIVYAAALFGCGATLVALAILRSDALLPNHVAGVALFFLCYGLLTISIGYEHPHVGYYSFDRVSQVASILVLGPVTAALINGLASLIYPWHRIWKGVPPRNALYAALNNAGLMSLIVLVAGSLYTALGGDVPLTRLTAASVPQLVVLVITMQLLNDLGMWVSLRLGRRPLEGFVSGFAYALELGSGAAAVLVALVYDTMPVAEFALLLLVLTLGMVALQQFANMRQKLELIVAERTRSLREKTLELERQATRDKLTGLYNRRYADAYLAEQLESIKRHRQRFTITLADIDLFKQINDRHSHAIGDAVLRRVATILSEHCRQTDMVARYGGEEFLICFPHTELCEAQTVCEALRMAVESSDWRGFGLAGGVTISFGIAEHRADPSAAALLERADRHLYAAKDRGRNLVVA